MKRNLIVKSLVSNLADSTSSDTDDNSESESTGSDFSDLEGLLKFYREPPKKRSCTTNYFEKLVSIYNGKEFGMHFIINKELFNSLSLRFEACPEFCNLQENKRISPFKHMAVFLWFAAHEACSYRDIADHFELSLWAVGTIITRVSTFLSGLADEVFKWPNGTRKEEISHHFQQKIGFPGVIGAIGSTHVFIDPPKEGKDDYIDWKGNDRVYMQGICDDHANFIDVHIGYPGSVHDSQILQNSPVFPRLETLCGEGHILGDSAYPCHTFLLTPYRDDGHLSTEQREFNRKLSSCRVVIKHAFGMLKQRFPQLLYCKLKGMEKLCQFIRACCVLYNLANDLNDIDLPDDVETSAAGLENCDEDTSSGKAKRDKICEELRLNK